MTQPLRILHLEDDPNAAELIKEYLAMEGIACVMQWVTDQVAFLSALEQGDVDLILSDFALPGFDGLQALALAAEKRSDLPFILVSGAVGEEQAIEILKQGATDYVLKERLTRLGPAVRRAVQEATQRVERKRAEEALRRSEAYFRALIENTSDLVAIIEPDATIRYVSPSVRLILGYEQHALVNRNLAAFIHPDDRKTGADFIARIRQHPGIGDRAEFRFRHRDGGVRVLEGVVSNLLDVPVLGNIVVNARDVTDRRQAETLLQVANHRLEKALSNLRATQQELNAELEVERQLHMKLHQLSAELRSVQENERGRIARELHDGVAQTLSGVLLHMDLLSGALKNPAQAKELLGEIKTMVVQACTDVQDLVWRLRPAALDDLGLADAVQGLVANLAKSTHLGITLHLQGDLPHLTPPVETALYRIVQEALSNVIQHADATQATVCFEASEGILQLAVADNGCGFDPTASSPQNPDKVEKIPRERRGIGLWSMKERAEEVGGAFSIRSTVGQGSTLIVTIPLLSAEESQRVQDG